MSSYILVAHILVLGSFITAITDFDNELNYQQTYTFTCSIVVDYKNSRCKLAVYSKLGYYC